MIRFLIYVICIIVIIKVLNFFWAILSLGYKRDRAYKLFMQTDKLIKSECHLLYQIVPILSGTAGEEKETLSDVAGIISELSKLDDSYKNIDRKIALHEILTKQTEKMFSEINNNKNAFSYKSLTEIINQYNELHGEIDTKKMRYNDAARSLRKSTEVFPSSFFARLRKILPLDYYCISENE